MSIFCGYTPEKTVAKMQNLRPLANLATEWGTTAYTHYIECYDTPYQLTLYNTFQLPIHVHLLQ